MAQTSESGLPNVRNQGTSQNGPKINGSVLGVLRVPHKTPKITQNLWKLMGPRSEGNHVGYPKIFTKSCVINGSGRGLAKLMGPLPFQMKLMGPFRFRYTKWVRQAERINGNGTVRVQLSHT